ncbi:mannose-6-phosphate isomerase [Coccinella septempunctata]|uniref:mannose-6-phosphate isomerase n=1 Tax=Coccinella septempunctata TaxID=41139 RepID=UPI001D096A8F|nr:mannose-6-phosphate isomerase [Coccinella septempunctata]
MELVCGVQNYEWGKIGEESKVAEFLKSVQPNSKIEKKTPYAELWMGCHPSVPSKVKEGNELLQSIIDKNPSVLGKKVTDKFGNQLPFLFKILSIQKALSIQAHPSKKLAEELHAKQPDIYKDPNYKPEMAIALTPFEALCGFRPVCEIKSYLQAVPELKNLVQNTNAEDDFQLIKKAIHSVLQQPKEKIEEEVNNLIDRISKIKSEQQKCYENVELIQRLSKQFPGDVGIFMVYFLNHIKLKPGEAIYLAECEPHAYLCGDCVECMACSDNVVRAGLTPKFIDVDTLVSMLTYQCTAPEEKLFWPCVEDTYTYVYQPPVPDFAVAHIKIPAKTNQHSLVKRKTASILIVTSGKGTSENKELGPGRVFFVPAEQEFKISAEENMEIFQAFVNI